MTAHYTSRYEAEARHCARLVMMALTQRGLHTNATFYLTERHNLVWLAVVLSLSQIDKRLEGFVSPDTLHQISTMLRGKSVFLSNSSGLRYLILLTAAPKLPDSISFPGTVHKNTIPLGVNLAGELTLAYPRNILISGEPGTGKSTLLDCVRFSAQQNHWGLYFTDPDGHTFNPDVLNAVSVQPVAQSPNELLGILDNLEAEITRRQALFRESMRNGILPADIDAYNKHNANQIQRLLLLIDEANSYFDHKGIQEKLADLARRGRKWGISLVLAGHNWRASDVSRSLSAMFPVRISFRVSDDTSATVVLGSRRWGKIAQQLRQPGRGIALIDGRFSVFQGYRLTEEQVSSSTNSNNSVDPLNIAERMMVQYGVENLGGKFIVNRLASALGGEGITHHQVQRTAERFERCGWLTRPLHATDARKITPELAALAGFSLTGIQAVQTHTGVSEIIQE